MTTTSVWWAVPYLSNVGVSWRPQDYDNNKMVKCLKGEPFKGSFGFATKNERYTFNEQNREDFVSQFCAASARKIMASISGNFAIIPIPNSGATAALSSQFRTLQLAQTIASSCKGRATAVAALRWRQALKSSRKGGPRDPQTLFENLEITDVTDRPVVLFDDMLTSGAHITAAYRKLTIANMVPNFAVTFGRTTDVQRAKVLEWVEEQVVVEETSPLWLDDDF